MPISPIDRLLFAQGGLCFFCSRPLPKANATVEHLDAKANGGSNSDKNCVACCHEINSLLGSMSLKEKIRVILNQNGKFVCPKRSVTPSECNTKTACLPQLEAADHYSIVLANLQKREHSRPKKVNTFRNVIRTTVANAKGSITEAELDSLLNRLESDGKIQISGTSISYSL